MLPLHPLGAGGFLSNLGGSMHIYSVQSLSCVWLFATSWTAACRAFLSFTGSPEDCLNSCPLSWWCHPTISSSVVPFSSCLQDCPASGSFPMSRFFASGGQSIGASASASVLPINIQDWFPLGFTGLISLQSKGFSKESQEDIYAYIFLCLNICVLDNINRHRCNSNL